VILLQTLLTDGFATLTAIGVAQVLLGWLAVARFAGTPLKAAGDSPPMTILKPLHGDEPMLAEALTTLCQQDYPAEIQIVCGVHDATDTAIPVVHALQTSFPNHDIALVVAPERHGTNPKIDNLINMLPTAKYDTLVLADDDVHARPDYLRRLANALASPGVGLVTTLYAGLPAFGNLFGALGASQITHGFLPGALLGRALGRRDCLGATMCLSRETLARVGGLEALRNHLADDNMLGRYVSAQGLEVALAQTVVATTVPEQGLAALWRHELRWARTIRSMEPAGFGWSVLQYPLYWAVLAVIASGGAGWTWALAALAWAIRALAVTGINRALREMLGGLAFRAPVWLLPLRDLLSVAEWIVSHAGRRVDWRGLTLEADTLPRVTQASVEAPASERRDPDGFTKGSHA
jgi:ceramide glucosyltransferase